MEKRPSRILSTNDRVWYFFAMLYLIIDYGRPQDILPIGGIRPAMIIIVILCVIILTRGEFQRYSSKQTKVVMLFILLLCVYVPLARNNYFAWMTTRSMLLFVPFILSCVACIQSVARLRRTMAICIGLMCYVSLYAIMHGGQGSGNYFKDDNDLALYINTFLPFCYFLMFSEKSRTGKLLLLGALIVGLLAVVKSFSRGGFWGLTVMFGVAWLLSPRKVLALVLACSLGALIYAYGGKAYRARISTATDSEEGTGRLRVEAWKAGWRMFVDNPWGVGGNNFQVRFPEYQGDYFQRGMWGRVAHSLWLTLLPELGVAGVFIYLSLLYYNLKDIFILKKLGTDSENEDLRYLHYLSLGFLASLAGFFTSATFLSVLYYPHYWYLTGIIVAAGKIGRNVTGNGGVTTELA